MIDMYGIPVSQINNIKNGMDWTSPDGEVIPASRLTEAAEPPRSYAYLSDTTFKPDIVPMVEGTDTIYHESTYADSERARARKHFYSTASEAATIAKEAKAKQLVLGHYSARYDNETQMLKEAKEVFSNTILANEGMVIEIFN